MMDSTKENNLASTHKAQISLFLRYFAILREQRGKTDEIITTFATTAHDLYIDLARLYNFTLPADRVQVAVNDRFQSMQVSLKSGDHVVFIPPVAGG